MSILKRTANGSSRLITIGLTLSLFTGLVPAAKWGSVSAQPVSDSFSSGKTDNNAGAVTINVNDGILAEPASGTRDLVFTITLSQAAVTNVSVDFQTADGTAVSGTCGTSADYTTTSGTAFFLPGERLKTVNVPRVMKFFPLL